MTAVSTRRRSRPPQVASGAGSEEQSQMSPELEETPVVSGTEADDREEPDGLHRPCPPRAGRGGRRAAGHRAGADLGLRVRQQRDLRPLRGVGARLRRLRDPEPHRSGQRVDHGAPDHGRRAQARLGQADHRGDAVLRLRPPGQEAPRPGADLGPADGRPVQDRRRRPADRGRPAHRADPGLLRRPGRPPDGAADPVRLRRARSTATSSSRSSRPTPAGSRSPSSGRAGSAAPRWPSSTRPATSTGPTSRSPTAWSARSRAGSASWSTT